MPALLPILVPLLTWFLRSLIARALVGAGLAVYTYNYSSDLMDKAISSVQGLYGSLPANILQVLSIAQIPQATSVILSAMSVSAVIKTAKVFIGKAS